MKRVALTIVVFVLLGAVVNVAVAWAIVAHLETLDIDWTLYESDDSEDPESFKWWTTHAPDGFASRATFVVLSSPITGASIVVATTVRWRRNESNAATGQATATSHQAMERLRTGWPMRSMEGARWENAGNRLWIFQRE